jgi:hypothetical protein
MQLVTLFMYQDSSRPSPAKLMITEQEVWHLNQDVMCGFQNDWTYLQKYMASIGQQL